MKSESSPGTIAHKVGLLLNTNARPFQVLLNKLDLPEYCEESFISSLDDCAKEIDCRSGEDVCRLLYHALLQSKAFAYPSAEKRCYPYLLVCVLSFAAMYTFGVARFVEQEADTYQFRSLSSIFAGVAIYAGCISFSIGATVVLMDAVNTFYRCQEKKAVMSKLYDLRRYIYGKVGEEAPIKGSVQKVCFYKRVKRPLGQPKRKDPCCRLLLKM